jgi:hypothetical protein
VKEVLITGYPGRYSWMQEFVGQNAEVVETKVLYRVKATGETGEETFWLGSDYVRELGETGEGAA